METAMIYKSIIKVMSEINAIGKDRKNQAQGFQYRGIDDIMNELHGTLAKCGVFVVPNVLEETRTTGKTSRGGDMFYTRLKIRFTFYAEDGSNVQSVVIGEAMDTGDKASNKALSVGLKYALLQVFCIPTEDEKDPDAQSPEPKAGSMGGADKQTPPKGASAQNPTAAQKPAAKKGDYSFSEEEGAEMREMFESGFFPPEEQEAIRESLRKRESTAADVLWATRRKYVTRAKTQAKKTAETVSAEAERGASEAFDGGLPPDGGDGQQEIF